MRHSVILAATAAVVVLVAGCSTLVKKPYQHVRIETPGVENVDCILETGKNRYRVLAPNSIMVERSSHDMHITCEKAFYFTTKKMVESKYQWNWVAANASNGVVPGVAVDYTTNAIYEYPKTIVMDMVPDLEAMEAARASLSEPPSEVKKKVRPVRAEPTGNDGDRAIDRALRK